MYTPGFFSAGEEWLGWRNRKPIATEAPVVGELTARVEEETIAVRFEPQAAGKRQLVAHVVVLGMDLETEVRAGENRGRKLRHDFVVLDYQRVPLDTSGTGHKGTATLPLYTQETNALGVAVWVSDSDSQTPIQAVGGMLPGP